MTSGNTALLYAPPGMSPAAWLDYLVQMAIQSPPPGPSNAFPSVFDQLVYVSSLFDRSCRRYREPLAERIFGDQPVHCRLWRLHLEVFREWLALNPEQQVADLDRHYSARPEERREALGERRRDAGYAELIPAGATLAERLLFLCDLESDLEVLRANSNGAPHCPPESPRWRVRRHEAAPERARLCAAGQ